jgi:hypothetical protein
VDQQISYRAEGSTISGPSLQFAKHPTRKLAELQRPDREVPQLGLGCPSKRAAAIYRPLNFASRVIGEKPRKDAKPTQCTDETSIGREAMRLRVLHNEQLELISAAITDSPKPDTPRKSAI